jgi:TatD DNase family protein
MLVDSHCHLDFPDFAAERDAVVERARASGVGLMLTICTHLSRFEQVHAVAEAYPDVYCTVGVHPHHADEEGPLTSVDRLVELAGRSKVVGIGETGLDYYYNQSPREEQQENFRLHLRACRQTGLPAIVHTRDADEDTLRILTEEGAGQGLKGLLHCFSSSRQLAEAAVQLGMYISFSGILTFKKTEELRETARALPLDRLLVETDAPYLAPVPLRGKRNEPAFVAHTAAVLAEVKGTDPAALAAATTRNFFTLFDRVPRSAFPQATAA